ncbi:MULTISPECIES: tail fiber assembly protein [unclassified Pseudomonas]|uniref:tail fiber assembly protein n=1 Tax=unclassified Pseudomonas TaxID=196821 RepID=UPI0007ECD4FF|nr:MULTISPECIES: tail fiber assembly protein [unclassified Pseudomonas]QOF85440.1 tail fiber assembly protein [Pseudomonas sp. ADPe]
MTNYAVINVETGIVENTVVWNGQEDWMVPDGYEVVETEDAGIGWSYIKGAFSPPPVEPLSPEDIIAANTAIKEALNSNAATAMTPLLLSLQLGNATAEEKTSAQAWCAYARALQLVDLTKKDPEWPEIPM